MASQYTKNIVDDAGLLTLRDKEELSIQSTQLNRLRTDLTSITYERSILNMHMKHSLSDIKRDRSPQKSTKEKSQSSSLSTPRIRNVPAATTLNKENQRNTNLSRVTRVPVPDPGGAPRIGQERTLNKLDPHNRQFSSSSHPHHPPQEVQVRRVDRTSLVAPQVTTGVVPVEVAQILMATTKEFDTHPQTSIKRKR
jgi:hypothetical protein